MCSILSFFQSLNDSHCIITCHDDDTLVSVSWAALTGWKMLKTDSAVHIIPKVKKVVGRGSTFMRLWTCWDWLWQNRHLDRFYH